MRWNPPLKRLALPLILLGAILPLIGLAQLPVTPFEAHYRVYFKGTPLGQGLIALQDRGNGEYRLESILEPEGIAALLVDGVTEQVSGDLHSGQPRPHYYRREDKDGLSEIRFDWRRNRAESLHEGERRTLELEPGLMDRLSVYLKAMTDFKQARGVRQYTLTDKNRIRTYQVELHGEQQLHTPLGEFLTTHVSRHREGSDNVIEFWFAPALDFLPVQIVHRDDGGEKARLILEQLRRG